MLLNVMDVGVLSNFDCIFYFYEGDEDVLCVDLFGVFVDDEFIFEMIGSVFCCMGYVFDLYMVVGYLVMENVVLESVMGVVFVMVYLVKFVDVVERVMG